MRQHPLLPIASLLIVALALAESAAAQNIPQTSQPAGRVDWNGLSKEYSSSQIPITAYHGPMYGPSGCGNDQSPPDQSPYDQGPYGGSQAMCNPPREYDLAQAMAQDDEIRRRCRNMWITIGVVATAGFAIGASHEGDRVANGFAGAGILGFTTSLFYFPPMHANTGYPYYRHSVRRYPSPHRLW
jgi:hypothetical protein